MSTRVVFLILASDTTAYYQQLQAQWCRNMARFPMIPYYFVKSRPGQQEEIVAEEHTLWVRGPETWEGITQKTKAAFRWIAENHKSDFDFVCRPNVSSFVFLEHYLDQLKQYSTERYCAGCIVQRGNIPYPSGACYTLSMDIVCFIAEHMNMWNDRWDDIDVGYYLHHLGVKIQPIKRYLIEDKLTIAPTELSYATNILATIEPDCYHIRIKNNANRIADVGVHDLLLRALDTKE
jgi:hypothetical protein